MRGASVRFAKTIRNLAFHRRIRDVREDCAILITPIFDRACSCQILFVLTYTRARALFPRTQAYGIANKYRVYNAEIIDAREMLTKYARLLSHPDLRSGLCTEINGSRITDLQLSRKERCKITLFKGTWQFFSHYIRIAGNQLRTNELRLYVINNKKINHN